MSWHCCWCLLWLVVNTFVLRPGFLLLNLAAVDKWRCPSHGPIGGGNELQVLVLGFGRTGTTSIALALRRLGLKTYKAMDLNFYFRDVMDRFEHISTELVVYQVRSCGLGAMTLELCPHWLPNLLSAFPGAKVLLSQRDWQSWAASQRARSAHHMPPLHGLASLSLCHWLPYAAIWPAEGIGSAFYDDSVTSTLLHACFFDLGLIPWRLASLPFAETDRAAHWNETVFNDLYAEVRQVVPPGDLLEFDVRRHGWAELAGFLGKPMPEPSEPFPRVNVASSAYQLTKAATFPGTTALFWSLMLSSVLANWLASRAAWRLLRCCCAAMCGHCGRSPKKRL